MLNDYIAFYYKSYIPSIFVGATSPTLFFLIGSFFYFIFMYQSIPAFQWDDYLVFGTGLVFCYTLSAVIQIKQSRIHIKQQETSLMEIEEKSFDKQSIEQYNRKKQRNIVIVASSVALGILLLLFFIYKTIL